MITKIQLINWKSFADATLYIDPLSVLIGTNSSGKSNVLDALEFVRRIALGVEVDVAIAGSDVLPRLRGGRNGVVRNGTKRFTIILGLSLDNKDYEYSISVVVVKRRALIVEECLRCETDFTDLFYLESMHEGPVYHTLNTVHFFTSEFLNAGIDVFGSSLEADAFGKYGTDVVKVRNELRAVFVFKPMPERMRIPTELSDNMAYSGSNIAGFLANHEEKERIEVQLLKFVSELPEGDVSRVWAEVIGLTGSKAELYCSESWSKDDVGNIVDADSMSDGTLRFIAILVAVLTMEPGSLIAIEELDNGLHPSRAELLLRGLKELGAERGVDVLAVTHNPALLNSLGPEGIPFVSVVHRDSNGNSTITLLEDIERLPKLIAGGPLGELVTQGKIQKALQDGEK